LSVSGGRESAGDRAATVTQQANDKQQLKPVLENLKENTRGKKPNQSLP